MGNFLTYNMSRFLEQAHKAPVIHHQLLDRRVFIVLGLIRFVVGMINRSKMSWRAHVKQNLQKLIIMYPLLHIPLPPVEKITSKIHHQITSSLVITNHYHP
jgi:hypothetical protein